MEQVGSFSGATVLDVLDRVLDKGIVINADIRVSVVGVELLGIRLRAAVASFETAALFGLEFPAGVNLEAPAWQGLAEKETCLQCGKRSSKGDLLSSGCPWCGWTGVRAGITGRPPIPLESP